MRVCAHIRLSSPPCPICTRAPAPSNLKEKHEENWLILIVPPPATGRRRLQTFQKSMKMKKIDWLLFAPESVRGSESEDVFWWLGGDSLTERGTRFLSHGESFGGPGLNYLFVPTHIFFCARGHHPPMQKRVTAISSNDESFGGLGTLMSGLRSLAVLIIVLLCSWAPPQVREQVNTHTHPPPLFPAEHVEVLVPTLKHKLCQTFTKTTVLGGQIWVET